MNRLALLLSGVACLLAPSLASAQFAFSIENQFEKPITVMIRPSHCPTVGWTKYELAAGEGAGAAVPGRFIDIMVRHFDEKNHAVDYHDYSWDLGGVVAFNPYGSNVYPIYMLQKSGWNYDEDAKAWKVEDPNSAENAPEEGAQDIDYIHIMYGPVPSTQLYWNVFYLNAKLDVSPHNAVLRIGEKKKDDEEAEEIEPGPMENAVSTEAEFEIEDPADEDLIFENLAE